ncbi:neural cell adhesion molecule 2-like [Oratosquilla oratoria]|uniref:neural cell adhesion molecule 2-like n=1 Tax=Oratosquilla oratoria TaxID=337810 RepID=UPI003F75FACC
MYKVIRISWIRRRDWRVLTSGEVSYTHDKRFSVLHTPGTQDWTLHLKLVNARDNGTYECQVSTGTGIISLFVNLAVVTPEAHISGDGQYHVNKGSPIILTCTFTKVLRPPKYVHWSHNGVLLNYAHNRPDITIVDVPASEKEVGRGGGGSGGNGIKGVGGGGGGGGGGAAAAAAANCEEVVGGEDIGGGLAESRLEVRHAEDHHSGDYTCTAPNTIEATTHVFVSEGDKTAAVQRIDSGTSPSALPSPALLTALALALTLR